MAGSPPIRTTLLWVSIILGTAAIGAFVLLFTARGVERSPQPEPVRSVRVVTVAPSAARLVVRSQGTVAPRVESELIPEISGRVVWVSPALAAGGFFREGEPLVRIDPADHDAASRRAQAQRVRAQADHEYARRTLERRRDLETNAALSASQLEDAQRAERVTFAELEEARVAVEEAQRNLARTELLAPFTGRVREESVDVGQFVDRGRPVARLYAVDQAEIRLPVPDAELAYLDLPALGEIGGPEVTLRADFIGAPRRWQGRVVRTEGEIDARTRMVHVVARVDDPYLLESDERGPVPLSIGLFVQAEIAGRSVDGVSVLPRSALRADGGVLVVGDDDRIRRRDVEVLRVEGDRVLVRDGLAAGERVCVSDLPLVVDGMRVDAVPLGAEVAGGAAP